MILGQVIDKNMVVAYACVMELFEGKVNYDDFALALFKDIKQRLFKRHGIESKVSLVEKRPQITVVYDKQTYVFVLLTLHPNNIFLNLFPFFKEEYNSALLKTLRLFFEGEFRALDSMGAKFEPYFLSRLLIVNLEGTDYSVHMIDYPDENEVSFITYSQTLKKIVKKQKEIMDILNS